jgi:hypothetical protein
MPKAGKKHSLLIYTRMINRWWPPLFLIGATTLALAWWRYQDFYLRIMAPWQWMFLAGAGGLCVFVSLLMWALRKSAYVRVYHDYFVLATPFLRMKVSYRRILRTSTATMESLFPIRKMPALKREAIQPLMKRTAVIVELKALPMPRSALRLFLSPFFFRDQKTPALVILVPDWMSFSTELDSLRVPVNTPAITQRKNEPSILYKLPHR